MMRTRNRMAVLILIAVLATGGAVLADPGVWVDDGGAEHRLPHGHVFVAGEDGDSFDLADLADGETRTFGAGDKQLTATRHGDTVTLTRPASGDAEALELSCDVSRDRCRVTVLDGSDRVMVMVEKRRECVDGQGDCETVEVEGIGAGGPGTVRIVKRIECDSANAGECEDVKAIHGGRGPHHAVATVEVHAEGEPGLAEKIFVHGGAGELAVVEVVDGRVTLRCPEGDATLRVEQAEADDTFLCPKHSVSMERQPGPQRRRVKVESREP